MEERYLVCRNCNADLLNNHLLEARHIPPMTNKSRIICPVCAACGHIICLCDVSENIKADRNVLLLTGTAGAGKTAIGQLIESRSHCIFVDGDAIQKRVNFFAKQDPSVNVDYHAETIQTMMILCGLNYDVVVGYIINNREILALYTDALDKYGIAPIFRVLVPERKVCMDRDLARDCWTAGAEWVDRWYEDMREFLLTDPSLCIDNSNETLEETFSNHFAKLL
jgi:hypothetical protein